MRTGLILLLLGAAPAFAQPVANQGVQNPGYVQNYFARPQQPLSPYLNLLRGGSPAVNYFYGVRPGLQNQGYGGYAGGGYGANVFGPNLGFLPQAQSVTDPALAGPMDPGGQVVTLRPAGHPVQYGNYFNGHGGYQSVYAQNVGRGTGGGAAGMNQRSPQQAQQQQTTGLGAATPRRR